MERTVTAQEVLQNVTDNFAGLFFTAGHGGRNSDTGVSPRGVLKGVRWVADHELLSSINLMVIDGSRMEELSIVSSMAWKTSMTGVNGLAVGSVKIGFFPNVASPVLVAVGREPGPIYAASVTMTILDSRLVHPRVILKSGWCCSKACSPGSLVTCGRNEEGPDVCLYDFFQSRSLLSPGDVKLAHARIVEETHRTFPSHSVESWRIAANTTDEYKVQTGATATTRVEVGRRCVVSAMYFEEATDPELMASGIGEWECSSIVRSIMPKLVDGTYFTDGKVCPITHRRTGQQVREQVRLTIGPA